MSSSDEYKDLEEFKVNALDKKERRASSDFSDHVMGMIKQ